MHGPINGTHTILPLLRRGHPKYAVIILIYSLLAFPSSLPRHATSVTERGPARMSSEAAARASCARQGCGLPFLELLAICDNSDSEHSSTATECAGSPPAKSRRGWTPEDSLAMVPPCNNAPSARELGHCPPLRDTSSSTARHVVTDVIHAPHMQAHALSSPAPVPLSHIEEFFGVPVLMAQRSQERSYRCSQDGLSGPARLEASLPYRTGDNAKLEEVLGALTRCPRGEMPGRLGNPQGEPSGRLTDRVVLRPSMALPIEVFLASKFWE